MTGNVHLIGGEMYVWSDQDRLARPAGGSTAQLLTADVVPRGSRVLVAGPHDAALIERLAGLQADVTWLTRSYRDASEASEVFASMTTVHVLAGSLAKLPMTDPFDVVVALDGMGRLCSTESVQLTWDESLDMLLGSLAPHGTLLLTLDNPMAMHRMVQPDAWFANRDDAAWLLADDADQFKPGSLVGLLDRLSQSGLVTGAAYACFPEPARPSAIVGAGMLDPHSPTTRRGLLADVISAACTQGWRDQPLMVDPQWLSSTAVRAGSGADLAASWIVVASRVHNREAPATSRVIVTDEPGTDAWTVTYELTPYGDTGWTRRVLGHVAVPVTDGLRRDPVKLDGAVPAGRVLEGSLIAACIRYDRVELRRILSSYAGWLAGLVAGGDLSASFATPRNVVHTGDDFTILDPSWETDAAPPFDAVLARALRQFAVEILTGGYRHPWPSTMDADRLTIVLGAISGHEIGTATIDRAVAAEVRIRSVISDLDADAVAALTHRIAVAGSSTGPIDMQSFQRLRQAHIRQAEEIAGLQDKLIWLDDLLESRERALLRSRNRIRTLTGSVSFRVGRTIISPARWARKLTRSLRKRWRRPRG